MTLKLMLIVTDLHRARRPPVGGQVGALPPSLSQVGALLSQATRSLKGR